MGNTAIIQRANKSFKTVVKVKDLGITARYKSYIPEEV
jgi:hypothetical protein